MGNRKKHPIHIHPVGSVILFIIMFGIAGLLHAFAAKFENEDSRESCAKIFADEWIKAHHGQTDEEMLRAIRSDFQLQTETHDVPDLLEEHALKNICT